MRLPAIYRHTAYNLRGGFLVRPLIITMVLGTTGLIVSAAEENFPVIETWIPRWPFPSHRDAQVAQTILASIATSVMTVVSIVFAMLLMSLTLATVQFSPRILLSFARDRITQWTLGIFLGTFAYCMAVMPAAHSFPQPFEPILSIVLAMGLATLCVILLLFFIHHISHAISVNHILDNIARETEETIRTVMPFPAGDAHSRPQPSPEPNGDAAPVRSRVSGYIQYVDLKRLVKVATERHLTIHLVRRIGHFVPFGGVMLTVSKQDRLTPEVEQEIRKCFEIGPIRTLQQDIEFGLIQIVDIALRAMSPAVNDPTTCITCVDQLSRILICYAGRAPFESLLYNPPGVLRVRLPEMSLERLVDYALEQIRVSSKGDFAVSMRLLRAFGDVGSSVSDPRIRSFLAERGFRVVGGVTQVLAPEELEELTTRNEALQRELKADS